MDPTEAELESFRQQWRKEVTARTRPQVPAPAELEASSNVANSQKKSKAPAARAAQPDDDEGSDTEPETHHGLQDRESGRRVGDVGAVPSSSKQPVSALEHYEKAVEKETQGSLGDSVSLYRKAFRLDEKVHERYKAKHFPPSAFPSKPTNVNPSNAPVTVPNPAHHSFHGPPSSLSDLIDEFAHLSIQGQGPPTDLSPAPPCPIAAIPEEILVEILLYNAIFDVASFVRLAQVCKRLAYLVLTEDRIWRRIALGHEFGFGAMHYRYACTIRGKPLLDDGLCGQMLGTSDSDHAPHPGTPSALTAATAAALIPRPYPTYRALFHSRPRIRFNGCYISTVNYTRPGASSPTQLTWNSPVLIVTYYRYLRFFRDGTVVSLLTTAEPAEVVPVLRKENVALVPGQVGVGPMRDALPGRWRLSGPASRKRLGTSEAGEDGDAEKDEVEEEGMLHVETEGVTPKYLYKMQLQVGSAGRGARNNKLMWKGYWSYNRLTDDWGEFGLKNDRAFYWSRVKSYGMGL
ncbi:hypothetical protein W97_04455 [Coniosporium apollinis CBS 100218]|uniref:F-box domain-containing protein n=1 Tax=Coniosporium apollinis (strain CBS 100218) TaxID=1168221 RepID=R7YTP8_CONA1|nr:uncharacterized protein W97_04455 [Coniosporium apollinis CBS 100218]EON65218.1 hypothetical protein W97_04455 [Coniosporium apollinis CBS 100218]